jgi:hypothetical protein
MISVYLDTQHVSRIASGGQVLKDALARAGNQVSLVFSQSHVVESLPKDWAAIPKSVGRLQWIMNPSAIAVLPWYEVPGIEFKSRGSISLSNIQCKIEDVLLAQLAVRRTEWVREARELLKNELRYIPDENIRRSLLSRVLKRGKFTGGALAWLRQQQEHTLAAVSQSSPLLIPLIADGGFYDFLAGTLSEERFAAILKRTLMNPIALAQFSATPELASILDLSKFFWTQMDSLADRMSSLVTHLIAVQVEHSVFDYKTIRRRLAKNVLSENMLLRIASKFVGHTVSAEKLATMPGTALFLGATVRYALEKLDSHANIESANFGSQIKFKRSDFGDLTHLFYAPYVSVFGCDKHMRSLINKAGRRTGDLGTTDSEIAGLIDRLMGERNTAA